MVELTGIEPVASSLRILEPVKQAAIPKKTKRH
jgi:hypothetical protein